MASQVCSHLDNQSLHMQYGTQQRAVKVPDRIQIASQLTLNSIPWIIGMVPIQSRGYLHMEERGREVRVMICGNSTHHCWFGEEGGRPVIFRSQKRTKKKKKKGFSARICRKTLNIANALSLVTQQDPFQTPNLQNYKRVILYCLRHNVGGNLLQQQWGTSTMVFMQINF